MGTCANEVDGLGLDLALDLIDQREVTADVALPVIGPVTLEWVVQPFKPERRIVGNKQSR